MPSSGSPSHSRVPTTEGSPFVSGRNTTTTARTTPSAPSVSSSLPPSPQGSAASPLSRQARQYHTRLFSNLTPSASSPGLLAHTPTSTAAPARLAASAEAMAPRKVLNTSARQRSSTTATTTTTWLPTRLTSPYCVLSAGGLQEDFYTSCLSWGTHQMALALQDDLVLFHPSHPREASSTARICEPPPTQPPGRPAHSSNTTAAATRRATAVSMTRFHETSCFLGLSNGAVELYEGRGDGSLQCTTSFAMPTPPTEYLHSLVHGGGDDRSPSSSSASTARAARALSLLSSSVSSVSCIGTCSRHPWVGAVATAARGLLTLDARQQQPALFFGADTELNRGEQSGSSSPGSAGSASGLSRLQRAASFLRQHDRLCSVSWNATGSLVATGSGSGVVKIWSLSAPQRPLHTFLVDGECSIKALSFHSCRPYELLVGASAGLAGLRTYDLAGAEPLLASSGSTTAAVTQALYDPEGSFAVTAAGTPSSPASSSLSPLYPPTLSAVAARGEVSPGGLGGGLLLDRSPHWRTASSPRPSGSGVVGGHPAALSVLQDSWDDMEDTFVDATSPLSGGEMDTPGGLTNTLTSTATVAAAAIPPNSLVVWRCGTRHRESYLREALLCDSEQQQQLVPGHGRTDSIRWEQERGDTSEASDSEEEAEYAEGEEEEDESGHRSSGERRAAGRAGSSGGMTVRGHEEGSMRSEWLPMSSLPGHRARPLVICAPFPQSPFTGCYASIAGGEDGTIRFWRIFETASDASHWRHRRQAQQQSATTQEDMDLFTTPVLR